MVNIGRWNYETKEYDPYEPNPDWIIILVSDNMDEPINCANCGQHMRYGDSFTSMELHTNSGIGYPVCTFCHEDEMERDRASREVAS